VQERKYLVIDFRNDLNKEVESEEEALRILKEEYIFWGSCEGKLAKK